MKKFLFTVLSFWCLSVAAQVTMTWEYPDEDLAGIDGFRVYAEQVTPPGALYIGSVEETDPPHSYVFTHMTPGYTYQSWVTSVVEHDGGDIESPDSRHERFTYSEVGLPSPPETQDIRCTP